MTRGSVVLQREQISVLVPVRGAFEALEARAAAQGLALTLEASVPGLFVEGDRQRLEQVFSNLMTNAIKYTPKGGSIVVRLAREDETVVVTVSDTGVGIASDMLARVFDVFTQAERTLERREGGIGLGLAIVRRT